MVHADLAVTGPAGSNWLHWGRDRTIQFSAGYSCQLPPASARETRWMTTESSVTAGGRDMGWGLIAGAPGGTCILATIPSRNGIICEDCCASTMPRLATPDLSGARM